MRAGCAGGGGLKETLRDALLLAQVAHHEAIPGTT